MGRVSSAADALISGPQALSLGAGAVLIGLVDYRILLAIMSAVVLIAALWILSGRKLSSPTPRVQEEKATVASGTAR
jgi:hypothetical protein